MPVIVGVIVVGLVLLAISWAVANWLPIASVAAVTLGTWGLVLWIRHIRMTRYFASDEFRAHKAAIAAFVAEHNELAQYVGEIRSRGTFALGGSSSGAQAHLANFQNTSRHRYRRDRNIATYQTPFVHNCSLQVARNASTDPIKYVMKYFNIRSTETDLADVESLGDGITRLEDAVTNLGQREASITRSINPPNFIMRHYAGDFMQRVGVELSPIMVPYPVYMFEYVSAGGNSSQRTTVTLNRETIDAMIETMSAKIKFRKSAAGQRALMTSRLRTTIKERDHYTCRYCFVSLAAEPHLLLEVDHIMPVSKGGLTAPENLQTLCWRCNRTKANKVAPADHRLACGRRRRSPNLRAARTANQLASQTASTSRRRQARLVRLTPMEFETIMSPADRQAALPLSPDPAAAPAHRAGIDERCGKLWYSRRLCLPRS